ncbi:MAG: VWA domain-containing protein [Phycicoccus sp.]|nr:VWA domain-containing protein [Phycicoccus sp.]
MSSSNSTSARSRSVGVCLLVAGLLAAGSLATAVSSASAAPAPGDVSISDVQVTKTGVSAILTARTTSGAKIDPGSVKATLGGADATVKVQPIAAERRVTTLLIDTSGSMGATGMATVVRAADSFLASAPADVYVGVVAFSTVPKVVAAPTLNRAAVRTAIAALKSQGETSLYDAIAVALTQLGNTGDRSFVLLSDGGDTRSRRTLDQTLAALSAFGVRAQVVGFKTSETQGSVLAKLATAGHGSVAAAGNDAAVSSAFKMAAQDLGSQVRVIITAPAGVGGLQSLKVTATAGGTALQSVTSVNLAVVSPPSSAVPAPSAAPTAAPVGGSAVATAKGPLGIAGMLWFALLAIFVGVGGAILAVGTPAAGSRRQRRLESIERYVPGTTSIRAEQRSTPTVTSISDTLVSMGEKVMDKRASTPRTQQLLERADLPLRPGEWAVLRVVSVVVGVAGGMVLLRGGPISMLVGAGLGVLVGLVMPALFLKLAAKRRSGKFEGQLPDVLTLVASSLSTGFSLLQALDAVARDAAEPSAKEFSRALAETRIGADIEDSLDHMADRMDSTNMRWTGMAISIQRQVGGNLAETLRNTAATLRDREALKRHVRGLSAEGRLSAYILIALPIGIFLYMLGVNKPYVELLWTTTIGIGMLAGGLVSLAIGVFWMRKVVDVEV